MTKIKATNKITGLIQEFDLKSLGDFNDISSYIKYVMNLYVSNPWAFLEYRKVISEKIQSEVSNENVLMMVICDSYKEHFNNVVHPDFVRRKHLAMNYFGE